VYKQTYAFNCFKLTFNLKKEEVEHIASLEIDKPSYTEGSLLRIQGQPHQHLLSEQRRHYVFTADDYPNGHNGSITLPPPPPPPSSKKSANKSFPVNKALFQKFRLQQHDPQQQQESYNQHLDRQDHTSIESPSTEKRRRLAFQKQQQNDMTATAIATATTQENVKVCSRCRTSNSPEWRRGPDGHKT
jgi:hypothetical protein